MTIKRISCPQCDFVIAWFPEMETEDRCPYCCRRFDPDWKAMVMALEPERFTPDTFGDVLDSLEIAHYENVRTDLAAAKHAISLAKELQVVMYEMRALLLHGNALNRLGELAEGGQELHKVLAWAKAKQEPHVLARSNRYLATFYHRLGDYSSSLEHAVHAMKGIQEDSLPQIRVDHLMVYAMALDTNGDHVEARRRFDQVLDLAYSCEFVQMITYSLNNMAYLCYVYGNMEDAIMFSRQLSEYAEAKGVPLIPSQVDTIARIKLESGHPEEAERMLKPILDKRFENLIGELTAIPDCQLTMAEAQRLLQAYERAQETLNKAKSLCEKHGMNGALVQIRLEQSKLYAAMGDYKAAYEEHCLFHADSETLRSSQKEARTRVLRAVFETEEARRSSELYREMSLRDPLTGLYNRRFSDSHIDLLLKQAVGSEEPLSLVLIDLDHFKRINDTFSHEVGDAVLVKLAELLKEEAKEPLYAARLGGEEFVIIYPGLDSDHSLVYAEDLCTRIREAGWEPLTGDLPVTASIGVATAYGGNFTRSAMLSEADHNLYRAKHNGRNRAVASCMVYMNKPL